MDFIESSLLFQQAALNFAQLATAAGGASAGNWQGQLRALPVTMA